MEQLSTLALDFQIGLGGGFLGYVISSRGLRRGHKPIDVSMQSIAFGLPAILLFRGLAALPQVGIVWAGVAGVLVSIVVASVWRGILRDLSNRMLKALGVTADDGRLTAWDTMLQSGHFSVTQVKVHLKSGRELHLTDHHGVQGYPHKGLIVGTDGDLVLAVQKERKPGEDLVDRQSVHHPEFGARLTYVPADEIETVEFRISDP